VHFTNENLTLLVYMTCKITSSITSKRSGRKLFHCRKIFFEKDEKLFLFIWEICCFSRKVVRSFDTKRSWSSVLPTEDKQSSASRELVLLTRSKICLVFWMYLCLAHRTKNVYVNCIYGHFLCCWSAFNGSWLFVCSRLRTWLENIQTNVEADIAADKRNAGMIVLCVLVTISQQNFKGWKIKLLHQLISSSRKYGEKASDCLRYSPKHLRFISKTCSNSNDRLNTSVFQLSSMLVTRFKSKTAVSSWCACCLVIASRSHRPHSYGASTGSNQKVAQRLQRHFFTQTARIKCVVQHASSRQACQSIGCFSYRYSIGRNLLAALTKAMNADVNITFGVSQEDQLNLTFANRSLENRTNTTRVRKHLQMDFILSLSIDVPLLSCALLLFFSLLYYGIQTQRYFRRSSSDFNGGIVFIFAVLSPLLLAARLLGTIILVTLPPYEPGHEQVCGIIFDVNIVFYVSALVPVYVLLWLRQRVLYKHPLMKEIYSKPLSTMSWMCLILLIIGAIALIILYSAPDNITSGYRGCVAKTAGGTSVVPNIMTIVVIVSGQSMLLALFVIPLRRQLLPQAELSPSRKRRMSERLMEGFRRVTFRSNWGAEIQSYNAQLRTSANHPELLRANTTSQAAVPPQANSTGRSKRDKQKKNATAMRVKRLLFRSTRFAVVCITSDLAANLVVLAIGSKYPKNIPFVVYDISLFVNVLCIILSFDHWKFMIFSLFYSHRKQTHAVTEFSSKQNSGNEGSQVE